MSGWRTLKNNETLISEDRVRWVNTANQGEYTYWIDEVVDGRAYYGPHYYKNMHSQLIEEMVGASDWQVWIASENTVKKEEIGMNYLKKFFRYQPTNKDKDTRVTWEEGSELFYLFHDESGMEFIFNIDEIPRMIDIFKELKGLSDYYREQNTPSKSQ